jgi:hypothetical protein
LAPANTHQCAGRRSRETTIGQVDHHTPDRSSGSPSSHVAPNASMIDTTNTAHLPGPQNLDECHLYFAEGCHLYMAAIQHVGAR